MFALNWSDPGTIAITCVVILILGGIVFVVARNAGWTPPPWFMHIVGLVVLGVVAIIAIKIVLSL